MTPEQSSMTAISRNRILGTTAWQFLPGILIVLMSRISFHVLEMENHIQPVWIGWLIVTPLFAGPWVLQFIMPQLHHPIILLSLSGLRLIALPLILVLLEKSPDGLDPTVLGWTVSLYILNLTGMILLEMRMPAQSGSSNRK